jgi:crotonobetainyl-CoA:carnitine CoA-transferase CaiB-like acyl-CoA transferase
MSMLQDVKIVAFTQFLLGPAAVQYLADMGAQVVKVEPPGRGAYERGWSGGGSWAEGVSVFFLLAHRNARSITIDLKSAEGQELARRLVDEADVVVENFRPGVAQRLGLDYDELRERNPGLIYATASGYGSDSPYRDLPGQDLLLQAMTGLAAATGRATDPPTAAGAAIVDQHAAALLALGILGALHHRNSTGEGQRVEVTMVQAALDLQTEPFVYHVNGGTVQRPQEPLASGFHEGPYGFYECSDGHIALSLSPVKLIGEALGRSEELREFDDRALAFARRDDIHRAIAPLLLDYATAELVELFRSRGVWCAPVNDYDAALADPVVAHVDPLVTIQHPEAGEVRLLKHPVRYSAWSADVRQLPPRLGEHTDAVLAELGVDPGDVARLRESGVV